MTRTCSLIFTMVASSVWLAACAQPSEDGVSASNPMSSTGPAPVVAVDAGVSSVGPSQPGPVGPAVFSPVADSGAVYTIDTATMGFEDGGCGASAVEAKQVVIKEEKVVEEKIDEIQPVALYIMLDQSISMVQQGLWVPARDALKAFVNDPKSAGIDVALQFFPIFDLLTLLDEPVCDGTGLDTPAVAMGRLPMHASNVTQALDALQPMGIGTPIEAALRGASSFCKRFEQTSMGEKCVAVLVTDGAPSGCQQGRNELVQIAQMNYAGGMGPRTFTVGLQGADFALLDGLAQAGGAIDCDMTSERFACDVSAGPNMLGAALHKIRDVVTTVKTHVETTTHVQDVPVECEWTVPTPPAGGMFDRKRVNVRVTAPKLAKPIDLGQVDGAAACVEKGWHYDNPDAPTRLIACPQTCTMLKATPQARVDILLGCATVTLR